MLVGGAVVAAGEGLPLARRALPSAGMAGPWPPVETDIRRQLLEMLEGEIHIALDHQIDLDLVGEGEVFAHLTEQRAGRAREIAAVVGHPPHRRLACLEDLMPFGRAFLRGLARRD